MNQLVLSIGSNSNDKTAQVEHCISWLKSTLSQPVCSSVYTTQALNDKDPDYLNAVLKAECDGEYECMRATFKQYEASCGRTPQSKLEGNIPIDIDIVLWNGEVIRENDFSRLFFQKGWKQIAE